MRKRNVNHLADTIFWYLVYFLPVLAWLLFLIAEPSTSGSAVNFSTFLSNCGFAFATDNIIIQCLSDLFGVNGILPLFATDTVFIIFGWFICTFLIHLAVDFLLFIPRIAHKWLDKFCQNDD